MSHHYRPGLRSDEALEPQEMTSFDQPGGMGLGDGDHTFEHADIKWRSVIGGKISGMTVICMILNRMIGKRPLRFTLPR